MVHLHAEFKRGGLQDSVSGERPERLGLVDIDIEILVFFVGVFIFKFKLRFSDTVGAGASAVAGLVQRIEVERTVSACG